MNKSVHNNGENEYYIRNVGKRMKWMYNIKIKREKEPNMKQQ